MMLASIPLAHPPAEKGSRKADDRERKRRDRTAMREAGIPDQRMLDAAIVDAIRDVILLGGLPDQDTVIPFREIIRRASESLQGRTQKGIALNRFEVHRAIANRIAPKQD